MRSLSGRGRLDRSKHPQSRLLVTGLLGGALGGSPPGKSEPSARCNYCMDNYTIQSLLENAGLVPEQGGTVPGLQPVTASRVEFERKRENIQLPKNPHWQGQDLANVKPREVGN